MLGLKGTPFSSKKLKNVACAEVDSSKHRSNNLSCVLSHLEKLGRPSPLTRNYDLNTELVPPDANAIGIEIIMICDDYEGQIKSRTMLRDGLALNLLRELWVYYSSQRLMQRSPVIEPLI